MVVLAHFDCTQVDLCWFHRPIIAQAFYKGKAILSCICKRKAFLTR